MKNHYVAYAWIYFIFAVAVSIFTQLKVPTVTHFILGSLITFVFFIGVYFCLKNISSSKFAVRIVRGISAIILLGLVYVSYSFASIAGFNSAFCYNVAAKDIFTGSIKVYCDAPPWHTKRIGGEEARQILLSNCLSRKSEFYISHPNYCDPYKNSSPDKDWAKGPNP